MKQFAVVLMTVVACGAVAVAVGESAQAALKAQKGGKPAPATEFPAKLVFMDRPDDAITSDGKGAYTHGVDGVTALFQKGTGSDTQFLLKFGAVKGKILRKINYAYTAGVATTCDSSPNDNPTGTIIDSGYVDFLNLGGMAVGSVVAKQGGFHTAAGTFRFHDATKLDPVNPYNCGALLVVTRSNGTSWIVTTDTAPGQVYFNSVGTPVYTANPEEVGSTAQLDRDSTGQFVGNYRMPFFATVTCLSATVCPTPGG